MMASPRCGAVIVTYRPDVDSVQRLVKLLRPQVQVLYVVDNGSAADMMQRLQVLAASAACEFVRFGNNRGIAAAHNEGIARAADAGLDYLVLFDQDSLPAHDLVARLVAAHEGLRSEGHRVAAVGGLWADERSGRLGRFYRIRGGRIVGLQCAEAAPPVEVDFLISSGSMLSMTAVREIGPMREDLFIDHVDTEWCLRAGRAGWRLYGVPAARLTHSLGDAARRVWLGRWREVAVHSPDRNYYEVRNTLLLLRMRGIGANWTIAQLTRLVQLVAFYALVVAPRWIRVKRMAQGLRDGLMGRGGPLS
jgi:rhamnosyltransferase